MQLPAVLLLILIILSGCRKEKTTEKSGVSMASTLPIKASPPKPLSADFKEYWYSGVAELNSYSLQQARYGEVRNGEAVLIFVTEPFNADKQVKADRPGNNSVSVLKLNRVRKFLTGVYPYSIMSSIFYPVADNQHALKVAASVQEWCGHVYTQLNTREAFEIVSHSYFESEGDQTLRLPKTTLEDEIWTKIRLDPESLPLGTLQVIPSMEYLRLKHRPIQAYQAAASLSENDKLRTYTLTYPQLNRTLEIYFEAAFPYAIEGWKETEGAGNKIVASRASRKKSLLTPYWQKNGIRDESLRDSLGLSLQ